MPRYRLLTQEELNHLEKEFVEYLVVNGIVAEDWEKMKNEDKEAAEEIVALFSDVVMAGVLRKIEYLERRTSKSLETFQCLDDRIVLAGMTAPADSEVDFTDPNFIQNAMSNPPQGLELFMSEKKYEGERELELFSMTEQGCDVSDGGLFKAICLAKASQA